MSPTSRTTRHGSTRAPKELDNTIAGSLILSMSCGESAPAFRRVVEAVR